MASKYIGLFPVPKTFPEILHDFAKEVIRVQPEDIYDFGIEYFKALENNIPLNYPEKNETENIQEQKEMVIVDNQRQLDKYDQGRFNRSIERIENIKKFEDKNFGEGGKSHETSRNVSGYVDEVILKSVERLGTEINEKMNEDQLQEKMDDRYPEGEGNDDEEENEEVQYPEGEEEKYQDGEGEAIMENKIGDRNQGNNDDDLEAKKSFENAENFVGDIIQKSIENLQSDPNLEKNEDNESYKNIEANENNEPNEGNEQNEPNEDNKPNEGNEEYLEEKNKEEECNENKEENKY